MTKSQRLSKQHGKSKFTTNNPTSDREIINKRIFNASRQLMFKAFSDPNHLAQWWGPKGFTNKFHEFNMRPNGIWRFTMNGPEGINYENKSVFVEIVKPKRIVLRHLEPDHEFLLIVTFTDIEGKTELTWTMIFESAAECKRVRKFVSEANEQNFDRLEAQLQLKLLKG